MMTKYKPSELRRIEKTFKLVKGLRKAGILDRYEMWLHNNPNRTDPKTLVYEAWSVPRTDRSHGIIQKNADELGLYISSTSSISREIGDSFDSLDIRMEIRRKNQSGDEGKESRPLNTLIIMQYEPLCEGQPFRKAPDYVQEIFRARGDQSSTEILELSRCLGIIEPGKNLIWRVV